MCTINPNLEMKMAVNNIQQAIAQYKLPENLQN
jgi:hypothetical protein